MDSTTCYCVQGEFKAPKKPITMSEEEMEQDQGGSEGEYETDDEDEDDGMPSYEFRFECAKMLLELDDTTETAIHVRCQSKGANGTQVALLTAFCSTLQRGMHVGHRIAAQICC